MPWPAQRLVGGAALALAGLYALTPLKRQGEARCRELCALHGPQAFQLGHAAIIAGAHYGVSCALCSAALMVAAVMIGMMNLGWMVVIAVLVLIYKLTPATTTGRRLSLELVTAALGIVYAVTA